MDLVGKGWQDLDGELSYDLEVRYELLDKLGPVGRFLYWLNNSLMRVAVRGDFDRPEGDGGHTLTGASSEHPAPVCL